jgi:chemotaxis methyl-accepting protein methylase
VLLSFGCSTGEECFTLRKYFPKAKIIGADIRKSNLRRAIKNKKDDRTHFIFSNPDNIKLNGPYDIIFCLSVLCRWNDTEFVNNCKEIYPFTKSDETISMLANNLKNGGLLVIYNSNFRFEDATAYFQFQNIPTRSLPNSGFVHKFDNSNNKTSNVHNNIVLQKKLRSL